MSATAGTDEYGENRPVFRLIWPIAAIGRLRAKETNL
jgi:hypothetical protein